MCSTEGGCWRIEPLRRCAPPPLSKGRLRGVGASPSVFARQPFPSEGDVASKLPPASLPPWGEGRERGPPYFPPQGILIPSSRMLFLSVAAQRRGACGKPVGGCGKCAWGGHFCEKRRRETEKTGGKSVRWIRTPWKFGWLTKGWGENLEGA